MSAAKSDPALEAIRRRIAMLTLASGLPNGVWSELCDIDTALSQLLAAPPAPVHTVGIGPADTAIIDQALAYYRSHPASPLDDIARIRKLLASPGGGE